MCDCDCETPSIYDARVRAARKQHLCDECEQPIEVGEPHHVIRGLWDGRWSNYRFCLFCQALRREMEAGYDACDCIPFGHLEEACGEMQEEPELMDALFPSRPARRARGEAYQRTVRAAWGVGQMMLFGAPPDVGRAGYENSRSF